MSAYPHKVGYERARGRDTRGQPVYFPLATIPARIVQRTTLIPGANGENVTSRYTVHLTQSVSVGDLLTVNSTPYPVLAVDGVPDIAGVTRGWKVRL